MVPHDLKCPPYHKFKKEWKSYLLINQIWSYNPKSPGRFSLPGDEVADRSLAYMFYHRYYLSFYFLSCCGRLSEHDGVQQERSCYFVNCTKTNLMSFSLMFIYQLLCSPTYRRTLVYYALYGVNKERFKDSWRFNTGDDIHRLPEEK